MACADIGGRYRLLVKVRDGGCGTVFRARDLKKSRVVAIKLARRELIRDVAALCRFRREAHAGHRLNHPNIVKTLDYGIDEGQPYLVSEYVDGVDFRELIRKIGPLDVAEASAVAARVAGALAYAHGCGYIHRDIKPSNIMIDKSGRVIVLDFGLVRHTADATVTRSHQLIGTLDFIAPEQLRNCHAADHRADWYSLGATVFFLLTGNAVFCAPHEITREEKIHKVLNENAPPLRRVRPDAPAALADIVDQLLVKNPRDRDHAICGLEKQLQFLGEASCAEQLLERYQRFAAACRRRSNRFSRI